MMNDDADELIRVNSRDEIPRFADEDEERQYWDTHCLGPELLKRMQPLGSAYDAVQKLKAKRQTIRS